MLATLKNSKQITILSIIFVGLMIPNVIVYVEHAILELDESQKSNDKGMANKSTRQLAEGVFFALIAIGYIVTTILIFAKPRNLIPYYIILAGTVIIIIVYYFRTMTGIPIIGTDLIIKEYSIDYRDVITKITQQAFVIPLAMMLQRVYDMKKQKDNEIIITKRF
jgi:quinol-cytochrome oxidoreductase complex cytochrome b subunit